MTAPRRPPLLPCHACARHVVAGTRCPFCDAAPKEPSFVAAAPDPAARLSRAELFLFNAAPRDTWLDAVSGGAPSALDRADWGMGPMGEANGNGNGNGANGGPSLLDTIPDEDSPTTGALYGAPPETWDPIHDPPPGDDEEPDPEPDPDPEPEEPGGPDAVDTESAIGDPDVTAGSEAADSTYEGDGGGGDEG